MTFRTSERCGLALQRFLRLLEQTHVLDRDDRLVGEGLKQLNVVVGKQAGLAARDADRANGIAVAQQRHEDRATPAADSRYLPYPWRR